MRIGEEEVPMIHFWFRSRCCRSLTSTGLTVKMDSYFNKTVMYNEEFRRWMPLRTNYNGINDWRGVAVSYDSSLLCGEWILQEDYPKPCNQSMPPYIEKYESNHVFPESFDNSFQPPRELSSPPQNSVQVKSKVTEDSASCSGTSDGGSISSCKKYEELPMPSYCIFPNVAKKYTKSSSPVQAQTICNFCRQNGDRKDFYTGHRLKDDLGNVQCPVLRKHVCEVCGATGNKAHTISYCPVLKAAGKQPSKNAASLKYTKHNSSGRRRKLQKN